MLVLCPLVAATSITGLFADAGLFAEGDPRARIHRLGVTHIMPTPASPSDLKFDIDYGAGLPPHALGSWISLDDAAATSPADSIEAQERRLALSLERGLLDAWPTAPIADDEGDDEEDAAKWPDSSLHVESDARPPAIDGYPRPPSWRAPDEGEYDVYIPYLPGLLLGSPVEPYLDIAIRRTLLTDDWGVVVRLTLEF